MKIGIPLKNSNELAQDFAHSKLIYIIDLANDRQQTIELENTHLEAQLLFNSLVNNKISHVVSPFYSFMSLRVFKENNIVTCKAHSTSLEENISRCKAGQIRAFDIYESLLTGECAKDCLSCGPESDCH